MYEYNTRAITLVRASDYFWLFSVVKFPRIWTRQIRDLFPKVQGLDEGPTLGPKARTTKASLIY